MDTSMIKVLMISSIVASMGAVMASSSVFGQDVPEYAEVINIEEIKIMVTEPREVCEDVQVTQQVQPKDDKKIAGTAIGAVAGGLLGSMVGSGRGKTVATVAGAAAGGYTGRKVQDNNQQNNTTTTTERQCETVTDSHEKVVAYNVTYKIGEEESTVRMDKKPSSHIPLENGQLKLD